jgi:hypothetical protein
MFWRILTVFGENFQKRATGCSSLARINWAAINKKVGKNIQLYGFSGEFFEIIRNNSRVLLFRHAPCKLHGRKQNLDGPGKLATRGLWNLVTMSKLEPADLLYFAALKRLAK